MFPINQFVIKKVKESANTGIFQVGPLPKGYGHTLGNVYRRIMLSSIQGAAVTSVKINGIQHEYSTMAGLQDDVLGIVLALKDVAVVSHSDEPVTLSLRVKGKKGSPVEVKAADMEKNPLIEVINPEHVITTLTDEKAELDAEVTIQKGFGYAMPNEDVRKEIGTIPVDANFNPVKLVSVKVTDTRVGQQTDLDLLEMQVVTNGVISPTVALQTAATILTKVSEHLLESANDIQSAKESGSQTVDLPIAEAQSKIERSADPIRTMDLNLSTRLTNALMNGGYEDLRQLEGLTEEEVGNIKGMGEKSFEELKQVLKDNGITLI